MLDLPLSPVPTKLAPFVPQQVMPGYTPKPTKKRREPRSKAEMAIRRGDIHRRLENLLLRHDNYLAYGLPPPAQEKAVRKLTIASAETTVGGRGRPKKGMVNSLHPYVKDFTFPRDILTLPGLDDIMSGAVALDLDGNTRPLNKKAMAALLQKLKVITAETVQEEMRCGLRHAQKVAKCLRIVVALGLRWSDSWHYPVEQEKQWAN